MAVCCHFGVDLRNQLNHNFPSRLTDGTPLSSSDLLYFFLLLPFIWTNYSKSNSLSPFYSLGQNYSKSEFPLLFALPGQSILSQTPNPQAYSKTISFSVLAANPFQSYKNISSPFFFLTYENCLFLLTYSKLLPLEAKQCPLTLASLLACADSVAELRFWNKSES